MGLKDFLSTLIEGVLEDNGSSMTAQDIWGKVGGDQTDDVTVEVVRDCLAQMYGVVHNTHDDTYRLAER